MNSRHQKASRRHPSRRRLLSDLGVIVGVLGILCILFAGVFALSACFRANASQKKQLRLCYLYLGAGSVLLGARGVSALARNRLNRQRRRSLIEPVSSGGPPSEPRAPTAALLETSGNPGSVTGESGSVLILTLVILGLIVALVLQTQWATRIALRQSQLALDVTRLELAAADATRGALQDLANDEDLAVDSTNEPWASVRDLRNPEGVSTRVAVIDENRFFDLNNLAVPVTGEPLRTAATIAQDILTLCGDFTPGEKVESLTDWVDTGDQGFRELEFYRDREIPVRPPNRVAQSWGELLYVNGFARDLFFRHERHDVNEAFKADAMDCLTVVGLPRNQPLPVNLNTAGRDVLLGVFGLNQEPIVNTILARRMAEPLRSLEPLAFLLDPLLLDSLGPYVDLKSQFFRVEARAYREGQSVNLRAVVHRNSDGEVKILQWVI